MKIGKGVAATTVFLLLFIGYVVYRSFRIPTVECEICLTFNGESVCRTASSGTRETAIESAVTSACGTLAAGMTESIRCQNKTPDSVNCTGE